MYFGKCKMKLYIKIITVLISMIIMLFCSGCSSMPHESTVSDITSSSSSSYGKSSDSTTLSSSSSSSQSSEPESSDNSNSSDNLSSSNNDISSLNESNDNSEDMPLIEYLYTYRDEIIDSAIDVMYEHFVAHPTGLKNGSVKVSGEIMQVLDAETCGYEYYDILVNITYVPDEYSPRYTDPVLVSVLKDFTDVRPSVGDLVTIKGISRGFLSYESLFGEQVAAPHIMAAQIVYSSHTDSKPGEELDMAATDMLGLTVAEIAVLRGHSPSDYAVEQDGDNMKFAADDDMSLYSLSGYTSGLVRDIEIESSDIKIANGYGSIDNVRIGISETEFLNTVTDHYLNSYGIPGLYMTTVGHVDFTFVFESGYLTFCSVANYDITF